MIAMIVFSAAIGWCGTPYPRKWGPKVVPPPPPPPDDPNPEPEWRRWYASAIDAVAGNPPPQPWRTTLGVFGGIIGGLLASSFLGNEQFIVIGMAAFAGGRIMSEMASTMMNK